MHQAFLVVWVGGLGCGGWQWVRPSVDTAGGAGGAGPGRVVEVVCHSVMGVVVLHVFLNAHGQDSANLMPTARRAGAQCRQCAFADGAWIGPRAEAGCLKTWGWGVGTVVFDTRTLTPCRPMALIHSITAPPSLTQCPPSLWRCLHRPRGVWSPGLGSLEAHRPQYLPPGELTR